MENNKTHISRIKYLIDKNNYNEIVCYVNDNDIEFKNLCNDYLDIINYTCFLYEKNAISSKIKDFVIFHYDNNIIKIVDILNDNNLSELEKFTHENNIKFKDLNYKYFNTLEYSKYLYKKDIISNKIYDYILSHYNDYTQREKVIELMKTNDTKKLNEYIKNNNIEFKQLNDDYFDIIEYANDTSNNISFKMKFYVITHFDNKREKVIELMKTNSINQLKKFIEKNKIELRDLDDRHFHIVDYVNSSEDFIFSEMMKWFIVSHYTKERYEIIELIRKNYISDLKKYIDLNNIELESLNDDNFNLIQYVIQYENHISSIMRYFVLSHYNNKRYKVVELIRSNNIMKLKKYIEENNIYFEDIYDNNFDLLKYVRLDSCHISMEMKIFVLSHLNKKRYDIVERIRKNNFEEFKEYIEKNNIELKSYNDPYFDIIRYSYSLYDKGIISQKFKDYIIAAYDQQRREIVQIIKQNDINKLKKFIIENNIMLDNLNGRYFDIVKYTCSYLHNVSSEIKIFVKANHNKMGSQILINLIKENKYSELKQFVEKNSFSLKSLNNSNFNIIDFSMKLFKAGKISPKMKNLILIHYDQKEL